MACGACVHCGPSVPCLPPLPCVCKGVAALLRLAIPFHTPQFLVGTEVPPPLPPPFDHPHTPHIPIFYHLYMSLLYRA
jgi:hypothetical protein